MAISDYMQRYESAKVGRHSNISLSKYLGAQVTDLIGTIVDYGGYGAPIFKIYKVVFEGDSSLFVEGEHDCAYIPADEDVPGLENDTMMAIVVSNDQ